MIAEARKYQAFYTKSDPIVNNMVSSLDLRPGDKVLEPCAGDGVFVDAVIKENPLVRIEAHELNPEAYNSLKESYADLNNVSIKLSDTLLDSSLLLYESSGGVFDKIIANPPYGAWQEPEKRKTLKKIYPHLYVKETYSLFLYKCINLLKPGGKLSFIVPDTFLNLHMHRSLRDHILSHTKIRDILLFPSKFFPGVNFGYANLCIINLEKARNTKEALNNVFRTTNNFQSVNQLSNISDEKLSHFHFTQSEIVGNPDSAFLISKDVRITNILNNRTCSKIGDIASCVTGFYSGSDREFLYVLNKSVKNGKKYNEVEISNVELHPENQKNNLEGFSSGNHFVEIVKGGNVRYLKEGNWFVDWSKEAVSHYKKDKKARFQNPKYYFKYGIGVPMVSSSCITASLIQNKLFDQSIVGIFPNDERLVYYLLAFFNSTVCNSLIRTINPSANNPSNYIKKIPFIHPSEDQILDINMKVSLIIESIQNSGSYRKSLEEEINNFFVQKYQLTE